MLSALAEAVVTKTPTSSTADRPRYPGDQIRITVGRCYGLCASVAGRDGFPDPARNDLFAATQGCFDSRIEPHGWRWSAHRITTKPMQRRARCIPLIKFLPDSTRVADEEYIPISFCRHDKRKAIKMATGMTNASA